MKYNEAFSISIRCEINLCVGRVLLVTEAEREIFSEREEPIFRDRKHDVFFKMHRNRKLDRYCEYCIPVLRRLKPALSISQRL